MIMVLTAIRDAKTGFLTPAIHNNNDAAIRDFVSACRRSDTALSDFPEDFSLVRLGTYDTDDGKIVPEELDCLCRAVTYVKTKKECNCHA